MIELDDPWETIRHEEIRPIKECLEYYALPVYFATSSGKIITLLHSYPKILDPTPNSNGYLSVGIYQGSYKCVSRLVHRLIAEAFFGNTKGKLVHHKNRIRHDNRPENLEILDKHKHGRRHKELNEWVKQLIRKERELKMQEYLRNKEIEG